MKTTTIILAAIFALHTSVLFAGNESTTPKSATETNLIDIEALVPATPAEATFEEVFETVLDINTLRPEVPAEVTFEEIPTEPVIDIKALAPVTPAEADFE